MNCGANTPTDVTAKLISLIKKYWCCFCEENVKIHIKGYECVIDTGDSKPTVARNIRYGIHETPIMQKAIESLLKNDQITIDDDSSWLSRVVLAPKPHQEEVVEISDFIWRFCISYIALNQVTKVISYYIPRCDDAVENGFGNAKVFIIMDACSGFHQIKMEPSSAKKTAFAGPYGRKYCYTCMPFGLGNAPTIFVTMIYDLKNDWDEELVDTFTFSVDESNNSTIIIDDNFTFSENHEIALCQLEAILMISRRHNLSWKLKKCYFFPIQVEFVGHDLTHEGNMTAQSKDILLNNWTRPTTVRDVSSFLGFGNFYSRYIPHFEIRVQNLRKIITDYSYDHHLQESQWTKSANKEFDDIRAAILSKPLLRRVSRTKRPYLRTDFSKLGFGHVLLQPGDDEPSISAMNRENAGGPCEFDLTLSGLRLLPCAFGGRMCRGPERYLHSYLGEATALKVGILKNRHVLYGIPFSNIGDCVGIKWIMSYEGTNAPIMRLQMELMSWWFTVTHRPNRMLINADFFSRIKKDLQFDPLLIQYMQVAHDIYKRNQPDASSPEVSPENMPNYKGKRSTPVAVTVNLLTADTSANTSVTNVPIMFATAEPMKPTKLHHSASAIAAFSLTHFNWAIYGFGSGHFHSTCLDRGIPFRLQIAADPTYQGRKFFKAFCKTPIIVDSAINLLKRIRSNAIDNIHGYYIEAPFIHESHLQLEFLKIQSTIIQEMRSRSRLQCFILQISSSYHKTIISQFLRSIEPEGWSVSNEHIHFPEIGDCIDHSTNIYIGFHTGVTGLEINIIIPRPPVRYPKIEDHIYTPFDTSEFSLSTLPDADDESDEQFESKRPDSTAESPLKTKIINHLLNKGQTSNIFAGTNVCSRNHPAPNIDAYNFNPFQQLFGIQFKNEREKINTRGISLFEYCRCWGVDKNLTIDFAKSHDNLILLQSTLPKNSSKLILQSVYEKLSDIRNQTSTFLDTSDHAAPAAISISSYLSGSTSTTLPSRDFWIEAYKRDKETTMILDMLSNPSLIIKENLEKIHYVYRQPLRCGMIKLHENMLYIHEHIDFVGNHIKLQIVPSELRNIIFIAFHANPIGSHFDLYHTFHRIRLRYHWPNMYKYISHFISNCAGCRLSNARLRKSSTLVYHFPIDEPFKIIHADVYSVGSEQAFDGEKGHMNILDGMTGYAVSEPLLSNQMNAAGFAKAIMKILLANGLAHTIVIDKDSKFRGVFEQTMKLLQINLHTASGGNHDPILTERFHVFLNKSLTLFCNERDSIRTSTEGIQLCCYAWNSAPVTGTDFSRSLIVTGREFRFPIEYTPSKHINLNPSAPSIENYAQTQELLLSKSREIFKILIHEHRAMHREYVNSQRPDPLLFQIGDKVFAKRAVKSDKKRGRVGKIMIKHTGPWEVIAKLDGSSYTIRHCRTNAIDKKHAAHLSPCPEHLIPFAPLSGPDDSYSQIHRPIKKHPYMEAGIDEYVASSTKPIANLITIKPSIHQTFPSLDQLNRELNIFPDTDLDTIEPYVEPYVKPARSFQLKSAVNLFGAPFQRPEKSTNPKLPPLSSIISKIIQSDDRLFFIAYTDPHTSYREWKLVRINFIKSLSTNPNAIQDGKFLAEYLIQHPDDAQFSAPNQRFWTEYHKTQGRFVVNHDYHLIKPISESTAYREQKNIVAYSQWIHIHHENTYIHGPFNFASINGRKTRDRISNIDWQILADSKSKYHNEPPTLHQTTAYTYSYHTNSQFHTIRHDESVTKRLHAMSMHNYLYEDS